MGGGGGGGVLVNLLPLNTNIRLEDTKQQVFTIVDTDTA